MNPSAKKGSEALVGRAVSPLRAIRPLHDNVLLEVLGRGGQEELAEGSTLLYRPANAAEPTRTRGVVISVGPGKLLDEGGRKPMSVVPGQEVTFDLGAGTLLRVDGREFLMVADEQLTGVVESNVAAQRDAA